MKYSPAFFAKKMPKEKWDSIPFVCKVFFRPIAFLFSSLFASLGFSANAVSLLNFLVALASCALLCFDKTCAIVSASLFCVWVLLDNVDGNIARCIKKKPFGGFFDAISGYVFGGLYLLFFGYYLKNNPGSLINPFFLDPVLLGGLVSSSFVLLLLFNKKYSESKTNSPSETGENNRKLFSPLRLALFLVNEFSYGGLMPVLFLFSIVFSFSDLMFACYCFFYFCLAATGILFLIARGVAAGYSKGE